MPSKYRAIMAFVSIGWASLSPEARSGDEPVPKPIVVDGVLYRVSPTAKGDRPTFPRPTIDAVDPKSGRVLWSVDLIGRSPVGNYAFIMGEDTPIRSFSRFSKGLLVTTGDSSYYVDATSGTSECVNNSTESDRECRIHHRGLVDDLVPIIYSGSTSTIDDPEVRKKQFPNARSYDRGGCLVFTTSNLRAQRTAVRYCETCRVAERTWVDLVKKERGLE